MHQCPKCQATSVAVTHEYPIKMDYEFTKPILCKTHYYCNKCHYSWEEQ